MNGTNCSLPPADYQFSFYPAVYVVALVLGVPGNLAVLHASSGAAGTPPRARTPFRVYMANLALADLLVLSTLPFRIHYHLRGNRWAFGDAACRLTGLLFFANIYLSICFMTCVCVDRYVAAVHPHRYLRARHACGGGGGARRAVATCAALWMLAGAAMLAFFLLGPLESHDPFSCFENFSRAEWGARLRAFSVLCLTLGSLLPSLVILVCYPLAARRIARIGTATAQRAVRVIYAVLAITLLCFLPGHVAYLLHFLRRVGVIRSCGAAAAIHTARRVTMAMVVLNTCLDPVLYYVTAGNGSWRRLRATRLWGRIRRRRRGVYTITATSVS